MPDVTTLRTLRRDHPDLFHPNQDWFEGEAFMDVPLPTSGRWRLVGVVTLSPSAPPMDPAKLPLAVELADQYLIDPRSPLWHRYIWCRDTDAQGQRIYVGSNGKGLEIHRHLHLTSRWGVPLWL